MTKYGIWEAFDIRSGILQRFAIDTSSEEESGFDPSDFFLATRDAPERVGEIEVGGDDEFLDEYFCIQQP